MNTEMEMLMKAEDIAKILQVSTRHVSEGYAMQPGFPTPIRLPASNGKGLYRWRRADIMEWIGNLSRK